MIGIFDTWYVNFECVQCTMVSNFTGIHPSLFFDCCTGFKIIIIRLVWQSNITTPVFDQFTTHKILVLTAKNSSYFLGHRYIVWCGCCLILFGTRFWLILRILELLDDRINKNKNKRLQVIQYKNIHKFITLLIFCNFLISVTAANQERIYFPKGYEKLYLSSPPYTEEQYREGCIYVLDLL